MDVSRKLGILVFCAVPAIIGGGIVFAIFHSWTPVFIYETLLVFAAGGVYCQIKNLSSNLTGALS